MGAMLVRNLSDEVMERLKARAAENGRSVEAEHRAILEQAVASRLSPRAVEALLAKARSRAGDRPQTPAEVLLAEGRAER